jgi:hypothetical protein
MMGITGPHPAKWICDWLQHYSWEIMNYSPYNPNLLASDFLLFGPLKKHLESKQFAIDADVKEGVTWLETFNTSFFYNKIKGLVPWWYIRLDVW